MQRTLMIIPAIALLLLPLTGAAAKTPLSTASDECSSDGEFGFVCGPQNAEDLIVIPGTDWLIVSDLGAPVGTGEGLNLVDTRKKTSRQASLKKGPINKSYASCPGALEWSNYSFHGLSISPAGEGKNRLFAVNHGARESIEIFDINLDKSAPTLRWVGCVLLPDGAMGNAVVATPDGGFLATKFGQAGDPQFMEKLATGQKTGTVLHWTPSNGFTDLEYPISGANGIEVSADGRWMFVSAWSERQVFRFDLTGQSLAVALETDFLPDNLHWDSKGKLLVVGQTETVADLMACRSPSCGGWKAIEIDPDTMQSKTLMTEEGRTGFVAASGAVEIDNMLWIGMPHGNRIAYVKAPNRPAESSHR